MDTQTLLQAAMGLHTVGGDGPYVHTFTPAQPVVDAWPPGTELTWDITREGVVTCEVAVPASAMSEALLHAIRSVCDAKGRERRHVERRGRATHRRDRKHAQARAARQGQR